MNFFEHQHRARRKTGILIVYFVLAVILIIVAINAVVWVTLLGTVTTTPALNEWLQQPYWIWISLGVLAAITIGMTNTFIRLRGGGRAVAEMVGAKRVSMSTQDPDERKLINIVEEMSIASGTPMPALYVLEDTAINAFVAGYRPTEAVLVVTREALKQFNRDELQGVIGHEYSHILNGDMRINIRLMGILAGILLISQAGRIIMRSTRRSRGKGAGQAVLFGFALFVVGYVGLFFGSLIKAAVSRQRELLADAASVQFTRNPDGIAGALWKIKQHTDGSLLTNNHSDDISHFCFGESVKFRFASLMATHPPLDQRIRAINPYFVGRVHKKPPGADEPGSTKPGMDMPGAAMGFAGNSDTAVNINAADIAASAGTISPAHYDYAATVHNAIPEQIMSTLHTVQGARLVIYALLLSVINKQERDNGIKLIAIHENQKAAGNLPELIKAVRECGINNRLALLNLTLPALKESTPAERQQFLQLTETVIKSDQQYTLFEFVLYTLLQEHLSADAEQDKPVTYFKYADVEPELRTLISVMIAVGGHTAAEADEIFQRVMRTFLSKAAGAPDKNYRVQMIHAALQKLAELSPLLKQSVIEACADCVLHDGKVKPQEAELLRAVAEVLDCPMPPLLPN